MAFLTTKTSQKITAISIDLLFFLGLMPFGWQSAQAQTTTADMADANRTTTATTLACENVNDNLNLLTLVNYALVRYKAEVRNITPLGTRASNRPAPVLDAYTVVTNNATIEANPTKEANLPLRLISLGVEDLEGNSAVGLGAIALDLVNLYQQSGLDESTARTASLRAIERWSQLLPNANSAEVAAAITAEVRQLTDDRESLEAIDRLDTDLVTVLAGFGTVSLNSLGLPLTQTEQISTTKLEPQTTESFDRQILRVTEAVANDLNSPEYEALLIAAIDRSQEELDNIRTNQQTLYTTGDRVRFRFRLDNQQDRVGTIDLPNAATITETSLTGAGTITKVSYRLTDDEATEAATDITEAGEQVSIPAQSSLELDIEVEIGATSSTEVAAVGIELQPNCGQPVAQAFNLLPPLNDDGNELIDPLGQITGCAGELLPDYRGFSVTLFDPDPSDPTGSNFSKVTELTETELPNDPDNDIPKGIEPNTQNSNPFFLVNSDEGRYSFLFDDDLDQLDLGATYILVVSPPENAEYNERRVRLVIGERQGNIVEYTATSLDGRPVSATDGRTTVRGEIVIVEDAERVGLDLAVLDLASSVCDAQEIQITKTGDRATAEPGDVVLYRLAVRNLASAPIENLLITDTLPPGFKLESDSVRAEVNEAEIEVAIAQNGLTFEIDTDITLEPGETVNLIYAAQVTPNALRGSGRNSAIANATRADNNSVVRDGPVFHTLRLEPGIIEDAGTLIGRVFVDKNFDGEQQSGEPGIPNAVIYLEDGNRVITDPDGLFSVKNVLPGVHTGILDLTSIPEYNLAPNIRFIERNSTSRLVRLEPGGLVRMNFGVTPTAESKTTDSPRKLPQD